MIKIIPLALLILSIFSHSLYSHNNDSENSEKQISRVLNLFHKAASDGDAKNYFSLFSHNAIFIGTDPDETWTLKEFKAFAEPYFKQGIGWTYIPRNRHIYFSKSTQTAWFDEVLDNEKYGETRGTGVLIKTAKGWKIAQYHLTLPIPNAITTEVVKLIKTNQTKSNER